MRKTIRLLALLLGVQLVVAAALGWLDRGISAPAADARLLEVARERIDGVTIEGPDAGKVVLAKANGQWLVEEDGFPADKQRVEQLLERLEALRTGTPVATSANARKRFKVDEEAFERRVRLMAGGETTATLYLGTSPKLRRVHARADGDEAIHSVELATYDVPAKAADWRDKAVVSIPAAEIRRIEVASLVVSRRDDAAGNKTKEGETPSWIAEGFADGGRLKTDGIDRLAGLIAGLRFTEVLGREAKPAYRLDEPVLAMRVTRTGGERVSYRLGKAHEEDRFTLQTSLRPEYFRIDAATAKSLLEAAKRESLIEPQSPA